MMVGRDSGARSQRLGRPRQGDSSLRQVRVEPRCDPCGGRASIQSGFHSPEPISHGEGHAVRTLAAVVAVLEDGDVDE